MRDFSRFLTAFAKSVAVSLVNWKEICGKTALNRSTVYEQQAMLHLVMN